MGFSSFGLGTFGILGFGDLVFRIVWDPGIWGSLFFVLLGNSGVLDFRICGCWGFLEFGNFGDAGFGVLGFGLSRVWDVGILGFEIWGFGTLGFVGLGILWILGFLFRRFCLRIFKFGI